MSKTPLETRSFNRVTASLTLDESIRNVRLVSPPRVQALSKLNIFTLRDLVGHYPRRYIDMSHTASIADAKIGTECTISAIVCSVEVKRPKRVVLAEITLNDQTGTLIATAFRQPWLEKQLHKGDRVAVSGKIEFNYGFKRMTNPYIEILSDEADFHGMIIPVHPLADPIKAGIMRRLVQNALDITEATYDPIPLTIRQKYRLMSKARASQCIHFPHSMDECHQARRRLAYEEVFFLQLMLMKEGRSHARTSNACQHDVAGPKRQTLEEALPFTLREEQQKARDEISQALAAPVAMNHMLLGDVGTGKTVVAAIALAIAADTHKQALFMSPTEILAQQHALSLGPLLEKAGINWALLSGSTPSDKRRDILEKLTTGELSVLIGTHALLEDDVCPLDLSLAVIDEQQRFGVDQRAALLEKGDNPDALYLTATPIPRTLALALFGNISLSYLRNRPHVACERTTFVHHASNKGKAYDSAKEALTRGEQVYVVCPLVGDDTPVPKTSKDTKSSPNDQTDDDYVFSRIRIEDENDMTSTNITAATTHADFLQKKVFVDWKVGLIHAQLPSSEKQRIMKDFRSGKIDVLVATTVIEVGIDVPNATVMIIEDADRFGLSQLHQLRGRVGRGTKASEVHLISNTNNKVALERLGAMEKSDDGFEIAEHDLMLRREGDILGNRQHGASLLKLVHIIRDKAIIEAAHADALALLADDPELSHGDHQLLAHEIQCIHKRIERISGG